MRKYLNLISFLVGIVVLSSCTYPTPAPIIGGVSHLKIKLVDNNGINLLETPLYSDSIEIYRIYPCGHVVLDHVNDINKGVVKVGYTLSEDRKYILVDILRGESTVSHIDNGQVISPFELQSGQVFTTYIKWNSQEIDTIVTNFIQREDIKEPEMIPKSFGIIQSYDRVYYNDSVVIDSYKDVLDWYPNSKRGEITIVK